MHELSQRCVEVLRQVGSTQLGEIDEAIAHLEHILASSPKRDQSTWQKLGHYQQQGPGS